MFAFLILPVLVSGFIACHIHPVNYYKLHRYEGQYLYLMSARYGIRALFASSFLALLVNKYAPAEVSIFSWSVSLNILSLIDELLLSTEAFKPDQAKQLSWIIILSLMIICFPWVWKTAAFAKLMIKYKTTKTDHIRIYIISSILKDSPLDDLLFKASINKDMLVMLSLSDRKVYVGKVISMGEPNENKGADQEICIIPVMSGYRDKDNLTINFTTEYNDIEKEIFITISQDKISYATEFIFDAHVQFKSQDKKGMQQFKIENKRKRLVEPVNDSV